MPWKRAKALPPPDNTLFEACLRISQEAGVPIVVENVKGAQKWVGRAVWHYGSFYLWGDVPALMPITLAVKMGRAPKAPNGVTRRLTNPAEWKDGDVSGLKRPGNHISAGFNNWPKDDSGAYILPDGSRVGGDETKLGGSWFHGYRKGQGPRNHGSRSLARKAASAQIAKIPFPLAQHIARVFKP